MKNLFKISVLMAIFAIAISSGCDLTKQSGEPNTSPSMIFIRKFIDRPYWNSWLDTGSEIHVKLEIDSEFTDDAFLVLYTSGKQYLPCIHYLIYNTATSKYDKDSTVYQSVYEPFRDSLKIDGFHIRSYSVFSNINYNSINGFFVKNPVDYPVYFKKIRVKKGKNKENFKIVFPRDLVSIPSAMSFQIGVGRFNDEIKSRFEENFPGDYELSEWEKNLQNVYFEFFPDSSKTSFVFSNFQLLTRISFFPDEPQKLSRTDFYDKILYGKFYFHQHQIFLNSYISPPRLKCEERIIYR